MKVIYILSGVLICSFLFSNCDKDENLTCVEFKDELTTLEPDLGQVTNYINSRLNLLFPDPTSEDPIGHEANLNLFAEKLEQDCAVEVTIECYACIYTLPAQSHVRIQLDSAGTMIHRALDIWTPEDNLMTLRAIEY